MGKDSIFNVNRLGCQDRKWGAKIRDDAVLHACAEISDQGGSPRAGQLGAVVITLCSGVFVSLSGARTSTSSVCPNPITSRVGPPSSLGSVVFVVTSATLAAGGRVEVVLEWVCVSTSPNITSRVRVASISFPGSIIIVLVVISVSARDTAKILA